MNKTFRSFLLVWVLFAACAARAVTFTTDTLIGFADTNYEGADIIISNCVVTLDGPHAFGSLQVLNGGKLTHTASDTGWLSSQLVTNEQPVLTGTNAVLLGARDVVLSSVLVTDLFDTMVYSNGVDYLLTSVDGGETTIQRTDTSAIPEGAEVSVSYTAILQLGPSGLNLNVAGDVLIEAGGAIALNGLGYNRGYGPGHGTLGAVGGPSSGGGGGHGGLGGLSATAGAGGAAYDSLMQPTDKGSEGAGLSAAYDSAGGGAAQLVVGGLLRVDGTLSANGASALAERAGGGAGGSFWLTAQTFAGSGSISANGGDGESPAGGGGAGGCIAVYYQTNTFTGLLSARGGRGAQSGAAGTIYTRLGQSVGSALADNGGRAGAATPLSATEPIALNVKSGALVSVATSQTLGSLVLASNGWLSLNKVLLTVAGNATIPAGCGISADGAGFPAASGPGAGTSSSISGTTIGNGAGYGGAGAIAAANRGIGTGGGCYGSLSAPVDLGSGGGNGTGRAPAFFGGAGGGAIHLAVNGTLTLDGKITANGAAGAGQASGGGAGGSIWLTVGALAGGGTFSANGGLGNDIGGSGGGGRIALYYQDWNFTGTLKATGAGSGANVGGAGTIYTQGPGQRGGQLLLDNGGVLASAVSSFPASEPFALTIQGGAIAAPVGAQSWSSLVVNSNGWLRLTNQLLTITGDAAVQAGGGIVGDGTGFAAGTGPGAGHYSSASGSSYSYGSGGGFGGVGGYGGGNFGGLTYDSASAPTQMGSGGGFYGSPNSGGSGGGAIRLNIMGALTVNGRVSAEGTAPSGLNAGGGSGGCVALRVGTLAGSGLISANGGAGNGSGGGGGGGRIAVTYTTSYFSGTMRAWGGGGGAFGGAGTVYTKAANASVAQLVLDNAGGPGLGSDLYGAGLVDLTLRGNAVVFNTTSLPNLNNLLIASNCWLVLNTKGPITLNIAGNATIQAGGGITSDGGGYTAGSGPGAGHNYSSTSYSGSGGGYGGTGGSAVGGVGGGAYGSALSGPTLGSGGGGGSPTGTTGGAGGGALTLRVTGVLVVDGRLSADGYPGVPGSNAGGGSGGSLYITTAALMGAGTLSACGGAGDGLGGGGGGGRIFLLPTVNAFVGSTVAYGGNGYMRGGAGTVFTAVSQNPGQIVVDNGGWPGTNTLVSDGGTFDLIVKGAALVFPSYYGVSLRNLSIGSNSWLVFPPASSSPQSVSLTISGNADIDAGGGIKADGAGYPAGGGNGAGKIYSTNSSYAGSGGAYGGAGGMAGTASAGWGGYPYGNAASSPQAGSGGGNPSPNSGGAGGASLTLRVTGTLNVDGRISANGTAAPLASGGGGAGGGISITATTLLGSGVISANGGNGLSLGGGGGGGRIMLLPAVNLFSGLVTAYGGDGYARGGAGTIFTHTSDQNTGLIRVDNGGLPGTNTVLFDSGTFDLTLTGGAKAMLTSSAFAMRDLYVAANSWLLPPASAVTLVINGNGVLEAGGGILADGLGYPGGAGPGAGYVSDTTRGGGGYGGSGGGNTRSGGGTYGYLQTPTDLGSGGANYGTSGGPYGGAGGGVIVLNVLGTLDVEGRISANGNAGAPNGGGGSGGGVSLTVGTLLGSGTISANGGNGTGIGGGGGGGRVALSCNANLFSGSLTAYGGSSPVGNGGAGTIFSAPKLSSPTSTELIVDNGGLSGTTSSLAGVNPATDVIIRNGALAVANGNLSLRNLMIYSNGWLTFAGTYTPLTVNGNATIQSGGGIIADGAGSAAGQGAGAGRTFSSAQGTAGSGGGYGGAGGFSATGGAGGAAYGSPVLANLAGSGGGNGPDSVYGGAGGGLVSLTVNGTLQLDGRISANGAAGGAPGGGGGSGGSVYLNAHQFVGAGLVAANGGAGDGFGGGGGGGRIVLQSSSQTFRGLLTAFGGTGATAGGAGTIYTTAQNQNLGLLLVDNGGQSGTNTPLANLSAFDLTIQNGAIVSATAPVMRWGNLLINAGGTLSSALPKTSLDFVVQGDARIEAGGAVHLDGKGFTQASGPGAGLSSLSIGSGAGYGGAGGASSTIQGGATYGSAEQPVDCGSGGGYGWGQFGSGSEGGGALRLSVTGTLTVNGRLSANGNAALQEDGGGGSGGSLWLQAASVMGNGTISADGGAGELLGGGGGGGGRVAIYSPVYSFVGQLSAAGAPGYAWGQDGSVYFATTLSPLAVVSHTPVGVVSNSVAVVDLFFTSALDSACLNNSLSTLTTPGGAQCAMVASALPSPTHLQLSFPAQTAVGTYTFTVGAGLRDLGGQPMPQAYSGSFAILVPVIQGTITDQNGQPVPGVVLQSGNGFATATTDTNGNYVLSALPGNDVMVTPAREGLVFVPGSRAYTNVADSLSNQSYLAVSSIAPTLSAQPGPANLTLSCFGLQGVSYQPFCSTNLTDWVPYGDAVVGTNGVVQFVLPTDAEPMKFFRVRASN